MVNGIRHMLEQVNVIGRTRIRQAPNVEHQRHFQCELPGVVRDRKSIQDSLNRVILSQFIESLPGCMSFVQESLMDAGRFCSSEFMSMPPDMDASPAQRDPRAQTFGFH